MKTNTTKQIVMGALGMALVFLATYLIKIPNGIQGYFNLGDGFIMLFASIATPLMAFLIGGIGSSLADIIGGYGIYAIPTLLIKGVEALIIAHMFHKCKGKLKYSSYVLGSICMVCGYALCDRLINDSWALAISGVPANVLQALFGILIAVLVLPILKRNIKHLEK